MKLASGGAAHKETKQTADREREGKKSMAAQAIARLMNKIWTRAIHLLEANENNITHGKLRELATVPVLRWIWIAWAVLFITMLQVKLIWCMAHGAQTNLKSD